jgi:hypothetical protein
MAHLSDSERIHSTHNTSRFFVEHPSIAWLLVVLIVLWGVFAYYSMPQRKDPKTAVREAMVVTSWPGARAQQVEELVTKRVEAVLDQNVMVSEIRSSSREGQSVVTFELDEFNVKNPDKEFDDIGIKLGQIADLPDGAGPVQYIKDFGETSALMLTVASPPVSDTEISLRARQVEPLIERSRQANAKQGTPVSIVICFPDSLDTTDRRAKVLDDREEILVAFGTGSTARNGAGCVSLPCHASYTVQISPLATQLHAAGLCGAKGGFGARGDHGGFVFGHGRQDVNG